MNRIIVPGEVIAEKEIRIPYTYTEGGKTYSTVLGIYEAEHSSIIPLEGLWSPNRDDDVVGIVEEDKGSVYIVDLNSPYTGIIISKFSQTELAPGDVIYAKVKEFDEKKEVILMHPRKLYGGKIINVKPSKVPRIIGNKNTMLNELIQGSKSNIIVGMNGMLWVKGGDVALATEAILKIQEEAHTQGLTDRIKKMFEKTGV